MADTKEEVERISALPPQQAKFLFLKTIDPTMTDAEAARRSGYVRGSSSSLVKSSIRGVLGEHLYNHGITMDTIAEKINQTLNARKKTIVFLNQYDEKGKITKVKTEERDLGPDHTAVLKAAQTLIVIAGKAEKERPPELLPPVVEMSKEQAEALTGRGPQVVEDADYEEVDVQTG